MAIQIQLRRDLEATWTLVNPVLASGEFGIEIDTFRFKIGDGVTLWNDLDYSGNIMHSNLEELDYESSGHTGFQKELVYDGDLKCYLIDN